MNEQQYTMGYDEEFQILLRRRSAASNASHLLPLLRPGMRLLDVGCGPGTISMGLAEAVSPGKICGIDMEESQIAMASAAAVAGGHTNAEFEVGDALDLPYGDGEFDVVHSHAVMMHVPDPARVALEMLRVLKPGGIVACRDLILSSCFTEPRLGDLENVWQVFGNLLAANGASPEMGKEIKGLLHDTGFVNLDVTASFECFSAREDVDFFHGFASGWFFSEQTADAAEKLGLADAEKMDHWRGLFDQWHQHPAAFSTIAWGEAIGRKPG